MCSCIAVLFSCVRKNESCVPLPPIRIENGVGAGPHRRWPYLDGDRLYQSNKEVYQSNSLMMIPVKNRQEIQVTAMVYVKQVAEERISSW